MTKNSNITIATHINSLGEIMEKHIILKSSILSVVAGFSMMITAVHADQVDVQILGVNDFHGALDQTGSAYMPDGKVSGSINPNTEVFVQYIKNLEAAGQTVSVPLTGTKNYVTLQLKVLQLQMQVVVMTW